MNLNTLIIHVNQFLKEFDRITKEKLIHRPLWQINQAIEFSKQHEYSTLILLSREQKIQWLIDNNAHPFKELIIQLKNKIENKTEKASIEKLINDICNGKFLDSIGSYTNNEYSGIILNLSNKLHEIDL